MKINDQTDNMDIKSLKKYLKAYKKLIAYDPWTEEADAQLRQMWEEGISVAEIAQHFGRKQSAITVRMKKLGL